MRINFYHANLLAETDMAFTASWFYRLGQQKQKAKKLKRALKKYPFDFPNHQYSSNTVSGFSMRIFHSCGFCFETVRLMTTMNVYRHFSLLLISLDH